MWGYLKRVQVRIRTFTDDHWPSWKVLLWTSVVAGLAIAVTTAFDWSAAAMALALVLMTALHLSVATPVCGAIVAYRTSQRWEIPLFVLGAATLVAVIVVVDRFIVGHVSASDAFDRVYVTLAVIAVLAGFVLSWSRTRWDYPRVKDMAWDVLCVVFGFTFGILLLVVPLANWAYDRQTDIADDAPTIPVLTGIEGTYVALGDSYSAGEGIGPFQPGSPRDCNRSPFAYPLLLQFEDPVSVIFEACSGAVSHDVDRGIVGGAPPQIAPGTDRSVTLVTITIGGNDVIFSDVVRHCLRYENCLKRTFTPRAVQPGRSTITYPPPQDLQAWTDAALIVLGQNVERVFRRIEEAYPEARVVVLGYPYLFPTGNAPAPWQQIDCASVLRRVDRDERDALRERVDAMNAALYDLAAARSFDFISPAAAWEGHEACGSQGQYTNAVKPGSKVANPVDGATLHPNIRGQQQYAQLIACYLNSTPETPEPGAHPPGSVSNPIECE